MSAAPEGPAAPEAGPAARPAWLPGEGEMARRIRAHDWAATPLGPVEAWPPALKVAVQLMLAQSCATVVVVGPSRTLLYNDVYARMVGAKHPGALGRDVREAFSEVRFAHTLARAFAGETVTLTDQSYPFRRHEEIEPAWFDVSYSPLRDEGGQVFAAFALHKETTDRVLAARALSESEERQAFLLKLSDALRALAKPAELQQAAMELLAKHLGVMRTMYVEVDADQDGFTLTARHERDPAPIPEQMRLSDFAPDLADAYRAGRTLVFRDTETETQLGSKPAAYRPISVRAWAAVPLVKDQRLLAIVGVHSRTPRDWTSVEVQLLKDVAERTWAAVERARAEAALRESEARFRQFAEASSDVLWIRNAGTLAMEYVSPAFGTVYGVGREAVMDGDDGPRRWAALIVPDDRDAALGRLEQARRGTAVVHEFRIMRPADGAFRWIRNHDFPLLDAHGRVQRIGGIAQDVTEQKRSAEHQAVLLAELQHRVRNIMAVIRSITARTGKRAESVSEYAGLMAGRLMTLARVQALLTRAANAGVGIGTIVQDELAAQAGHEGQYELSGPDVTLSPKAAEVLTLAVHELATNALKYGALSVPGGLVRVAWQVLDKCGAPWLAFDWVEQGAPERPPAAPSTPCRRGFGSELIEGRIPYELGGRGKLSIAPGGARCQLEFPLRDGASILETDAPKHGAVFGGALDMAGEADLGGHHVLVVEDDFYIAADTARALRGAGAEVLGPCPTEEAARDALDEAAPTGAPTGAVVDINLGGEPSFALARRLRERGIALVFITGYDEATIPPEFAGVPRLQKPVDLRQVVGALAEALGRSMSS